MGNDRERPSYLRDTGYVANKKLTIQGVDYAPGDPVDMTVMPEHKVGQFLNQRLIRPAQE